MNTIRRNTTRVRVVVALAAVCALLAACTPPWQAQQQPQQAQQAVTTTPASSPVLLHIEGTKNIPQTRTIHVPDRTSVEWTAAPLDGASSLEQAGAALLVTMTRVDVRGSGNQSILGDIPAPAGPMYPQTGGADLGNFNNEPVFFTITAVNCRYTLTVKTQP